MATKVKWVVKPTDPKGNPHHWYATSAAEWRVGDNLETLLAYMKRQGYPFNVFRVSLPLDAEYRIEEYTPQVDADKLHFVGFWNIMGGLN